MTEPKAKAPNSRRSLGIAIDRLCARMGDDPNRIKRLIASVVVGQMLPTERPKAATRSRFVSARNEKN